MENLSFRIVLLALKASRSLVILSKSDEEFLALLFDPIVYKYKIKNKNDEFLHLNRSMTSNILGGKGNCGTPTKFKKIAEEYPNEIMETYCLEFTSGSLKNAFNINRLNNEMIKLKDIIKQDVDLYPKQIDELIGINDVIIFFSRIIQFSMTLNSHKNSILYCEDSKTIYDYLSDVVKYIIDKSKMSSQNIKHSLAYSVDDKCEKNFINGAFRKRIIESFDKYYYSLDDFFENSINMDYGVYNRITNFYVEVYQTVLEEEDIHIEDECAILDNAAYIFRRMNEKVQDELFSYNILKSSYEDSKEYIMGLSTYVFYKCKFLVPIEEDRNANKL